MSPSDQRHGERTQPTPLRALGTWDPAGFALLRDVGSVYRDGAESDVLRLVREATDLRSDSDEMIRRAKGWAQRYHVHPARANIVRGLDLPAHGRVLEIGAGCGAVTRYLGETCAVVDALEPVPARAAAAAARTADLPSVHVAVGDVSDVPGQPAYELIVVIGVLEYVGAGSADLAPYQAFLRHVADRLVDGGSLVLAIENRLGVKYLVGAPEDHTSRVFDSIESYPQGGKAHTFNRKTLETLMRGAGLQPHTLGAFPDYKMTRAVLSGFPEQARSLLHRIPRFPSPDWVGKRPRLADEHRVWQNLVEAGVEHEFANSLLVLARKGEGHSLWPDERSAVFYSDNRLAALSTETVVERDGRQLAFRRHPVAPDRSPRGRVSVTGSTAAFCPGTDLARVIANVGVGGAATYLGQWLQLLDAALARRDDHVIDLVPHNLVLTDDGSLHAIDEELVTDLPSRERVIRRGIYLLAKEATALSPPSRWAPCTTVGEVMAALGELVGLPADGSWLDAHVDDESALQFDIRLGPMDGCSDAQWLETIKRGMRTTIDRRLTDLPLGRRLPARHTRAEKDNRKLRADCTELREALARTEAALDAAHAARTGVRARRLAARLLPQGTRRRVVVESARRVLKP